MTSFLSLVFFLPHTYLLYLLLLPLKHLVTGTRESLPFLNFFQVNDSFFALYSVLFSILLLFLLLLPLNQQVQTATPDLGIPQTLLR